MRRAIAIALLLAAPAFAAKAPLAYPRTFYWRGVSADRIAALFGLPAGRPSTLRLRLSGDMYAAAHPTDLRMTDTEERKRAPPMYVTLSYSPVGPHRLTMEGTFYDGLTGIPEITPRFFFVSPSFADGAPPPEGWAAALKPIGASIDRERQPGAERAAGAPVRDVTFQVINSSEAGTTAAGVQGLILRVAISD